MGKTQSHIDNDIVRLERECIDIDNDIVSGNFWKDFCKDARASVRKEISEYKLGIIQDFLFGGPCKHFGDNKVFINSAIKQVERFAYVWMNELSEESRRYILDLTMRFEGDDRARDYSDYLNSPIWKYISSIIKLQSNYTCAQCKEKANPAHLVVHHRTYEHLGSELNHLEDLDVLCTACHLKTHGIRGQK